jgi:hypothetical protein
MPPRYDTNATLGISPLIDRVNLTETGHVGRSRPEGNQGDAMKILAIEREVPGVVDAQFTPFLEAEAIKVWELHQAGLLRELYFRSDKSRAVLVLECADAEEAR